MNNPCSVCKENYDELLILGCTHDVCIECATKHFLQEMKAQEDFQLTRSMDNYYPCELCFHITKLDATTIAQIKLYGEIHGLMESSCDSRKCKSSTNKMQNLGRGLRPGSPCRLIKSKRVCSPRDYSTSSSQNFETLNFGKSSEGKSSQMKRFLTSRLDRSELSEERRSFTGNNTLLGQQEYCEKHLDEPLSYFCFTCSTSICPECAIHGEHVGHKVEALRKASGKLRGYYNQFLLSTQKFSLLLASMTKDITSTIEGLSSWNMRQKASLKECFQQLHNTLYEKQSKLLNEINQTERRSLSKLKVQQEEYQALGYSLKQNRKSLKQMVSLDVHYWNFEEAKTHKEQIEKISWKVNRLASSQKENSKKRQIIYLKCDLVQQAIEMMKELVESFGLDVRNKELQGTASFRRIS